MPFSSGLPQSFHHWKGLGGIPREVLVMPPSVQPETSPPPPLKRKWSKYLLALPSKNLNFPSASPILSQNIPTPGREWLPHSSTPPPLQGEDV